MPSTSLYASQPTRLLTSLYASQSTHSPEASGCAAWSRHARLMMHADVEVYRLVARGTLEEVRYARQVYKTQHADQMVEGRRFEPVFSGMRAEHRSELKTLSSDDHGDLYGFVNLFRATGERHASREVV